MDGSRVSDARDIPDLHWIDIGMVVEIFQKQKPFGQLTICKIKLIMSLALEDILRMPVEIRSVPKEVF